MSVLSTQCDPAFSTSLGSEPEGVFLSMTPAFWGCGVTDSIRGFEPLDPGSIPGASILWGHGVTESITDCEVVGPGSNPGAPTDFNHWRYEQYE